MANFFTKIFFPGTPAASAGHPAASGEFPWLENDPKLGPGFRLSLAFADEGYGYGAMPDIAAHIHTEQEVIEAVRNKYSWITILDECISRFESAKKTKLEEFNDCTGFSDISWWVTVEDPAAWLNDMGKTVRSLFSMLPDVRPSIRPESRHG